MALRELQAIELAMRELLSMLREKEIPTEEINSSWARCASIGGGVDAILERARASGPLSEEVREALERLVRLNAITREAVASQQASLVQDLDRTRKSSEQMRGYAPGGQQAGGKFNVAG